MIKLELVLANSNDNELLLFISAFTLFAVAAIAEMGGGYLVWQWLRERKQMGFGLIGGLILSF